MKRPVEELVGPASAAMWIGTFTGCWARFCPSCDAEGYAGISPILDSDDQQKVGQKRSGSREAPRRKDLCGVPPRSDQRRKKSRAVGGLTLRKPPVRTYRKTQIAEVYGCTWILSGAATAWISMLPAGSVHLFQDYPDILADIRRNSVTFW
jgi:hypothetical protein